MSHQARRARRLFRATCILRTRAPSIGSIRISRSGRRSCARCSLARHRLAPCRSLRARPAPSKAGGSHRAISLCSAGHALPSRVARHSPRSGERCVSPTSATDSRHAHPIRCQIPDRDPFPLSRLATGQRSRISGGASLDGDPPASASLQPDEASHRAEAPLLACSEHRADLVGPRSNALPRHASRSRPRRPRPSMQIHL
jgi:hypothetical protein